MPYSNQNETERYGIVAILLHWLIAAVIFAQLWIGFGMEDFPKGSLERLQAFNLHESVGLTILILSLARLAWRLLNPAPPAPPGQNSTEQRLARIAHFGLYFLIIAVPLAGWATVSAEPAEAGLSLFGAVDWPYLPILGSGGANEALEHLMEETHEILVFSLIGLFLLHILAALRHQYLLKDKVVARMAPWLGKKG